MSVVAGVSREISKLPVDLQESGLAAIALAMAERIDGGRGSPSECGKVVIEALSQLRALAPPKRERDGIDEIGVKRAARRAGAGGATAKNSARS